MKTWTRIKTVLDLAPQERKIILGILAIALIGLIARYVHLSRQDIEFYQPTGIEPTDSRGTP